MFNLQAYGFTLLIIIILANVGCQSESRVSKIERTPFDGAILVFSDEPKVKYDIISEFDFQKNYYGHMSNYLKYVDSEARARGANGIIDLKTGYGIWHTGYPWATGKFVYFHDYNAARDYRHSVRAGEFDNYGVRDGAEKTGPDPSNEKSVKDKLEELEVTTQKPVAPRAKNSLLIERPFVKSWSWRRPIDTFSPVRIS